MIKLCGSSRRIRSDRLCGGAVRCGTQAEEEEEDDEEVGGGGGWDWDWG